MRAVRRHNVDKKQVSRNIPTGDECKIKFNDRETFGKKIRVQRNKHAKLFIEIYPKTLEKNSPADTDMQRNWSHLMTSCAMPACWPYSAMQDCIIFWPFYFLLLHRTAVLFPIGPQGWRVGARKCNCTEHPEAAASTVQFQPAIVMMPECIFMTLAVSIR